MLRAKIFTLSPHWFVAMSSWLSRIIVILTKILTIPLLLKYLGVEQYAVYVTLISLEGWFLLSDFGIGSGFQNFLSEARARNEDAQALMSSVAQLSFFFLIIFILLLFGLGAQIESFIFSDFQLESDQGKAFLIAGILYVITAIGSVGYRALYAFQKGYWVHILQAVASLLGLISIGILTQYYEGTHKLLLSLIAMMFFLGLFACFAFIKIFDFKKLFTVFSWDEIGKIVRRSLSFWLYGLLVAGVLLVDYLIMTKTLQARDIVLYNILSKIFAAIYFVYYAILQAIWPTICEMLTSNRVDEVGRMIRKYRFAGICFLLLSTVGIILSANWLSAFFFPDESISFPFSTMLIFALYYSIRITVDTYAIVLLSISKLKVFFVLIPFQALIGGVGQYFFSMKFGINGILYGLIASFVCTVLWGMPVAYHRMIKKKQLPIPMPLD